MEILNFVWINNTLKPEQNGHHFVDILKISWHFLQRKFGFIFRNTYIMIVVVYSDCNFMKIYSWENICLALTVNGLVSSSNMTWHEPMLVSKCHMASLDQNELMYSRHSSCVKTFRIKPGQWLIKRWQAVLTFLSVGVYKKKRSKLHHHCDCRCLNSLQPGDTIWQHRSESTLAQVMACCLTAPSHYLNQCRLVISEVQRESPECNFTRNFSVIDQ